MRTSTIRIDTQTKKRLASKAKAQGKSLRQVVADLAREQRTNPDQILQAIQDLIDFDHAQKITNDPAHRWLDYDVVRRKLGRKAKSRAKSRR